MSICTRLCLTGGLGCAASDARHGSDYAHLDSDVTLRRFS